MSFSLRFDPDLDVRAEEAVMIVIKPKSHVDPSRDSFTIRAETVTRASLIEVAGEIDLAAAPKMREALFNALDECRGGALFVDLSGVSFIDSCGLGVFVQAHGASARAGCRLVLVSPSPRMQYLLDLTGLTPCFEIETAGDLTV